MNHITDTKIRKDLLKLFRYRFGDLIINCHMHCQMQWQYFFFCLNELTFHPTNVLWKKSSFLF